MVEVFTYGNGIMLGSLFQAVAALTSTPDYLELIRLVFVITTVIVAIEIVWTARFKATGRLFAIIVMMNVAILTTTDVQITDRVNSANDSLVADVPAGLAAPLAITTAIGDWATGAFETVFSLPNDLRYRTNGLLFASRLVQATTQFEITDARMANNLSEFAQGCIYYGMMAGWFSIETVMESDDIWATLPAAEFGNAIFVNYENNTGNTTMVGCKTARGFLQSDWATAIDEMNSVYGQRMFAEYSEADAKARLLSSIPQSYNYIASISKSAADIVRQNAMINTMRRSFVNMANNAGALGAAQDYALAQAEAQQRTTYSTLGAMAGRMMSLFANVLETLIYGIFPIAFIFTLIALIQGKAILMYFKLLFWLQLWPPMFAILNFAMLSYAADSTTAAVMQAGGGNATLNMLTYTGMSAVNNDMSAMAGYLSWMIPMFSWAIVSGSGFAASQLAASLGGVAQSSGSAAAASVSSGNISLGNYSGYNSGMFQSNSSPTMNRGVGTHTNPGTGAKMTTTSGGHQFMDTPQNNTPFAANLTSALKSSVGASLSSSVQAAKNAVSGFSSQTASTFSNMQRLAQGTSQGAGTSSGSDLGSSNQFNQSFGEVDKIASAFAEKHGMSKGQAASMLLTASLDANKTLVGMGLAAATGLGGGGKIGFQGKSQSSEAWEAARTTASDSQFGEKWSSAVKAGKQESAKQSQASNDSQSKDIAAGFNRQNSAQQNLQSSLTEAQAWQSLSSQIKEAGGAGSVKAVGELVQFGRAQGYDMEQLASASSSIAGNSAGATQTLQNIVNDFVQGKAASMAGIGEAPSSDGVVQANQQNNAAVQAATESPTIPAGSNNITAQAAGNMAAVRAMAESAGVPSHEMVGKSAGEIEQMAAERMSGNNTVIEQGRTSVDAGSAPLKEDAQSRTEPGNQNHMVNSTSQVLNAGMDAISDGATAMKQVGGQLMDHLMPGSSGGASGGNQVGGSGVTQNGWPGSDQDLPPVASDAPPAWEKAGADKTWTNDL